MKTRITIKVPSSEAANVSTSSSVPAVSRRSSSFQKSTDVSLVCTRKQVDDTDNSKDNSMKRSRDTSDGAHQLRPHDRKRSLETDGHASGIPRRKRTIRDLGNGKLVESDAFCWVCHTEGPGVSCELCPRLFHIKCLTKEPPQGQWICPECQKIMSVETLDSKLQSKSSISVETLCILLRYILQRVKLPETKPFHHPVDCATVPTYTDYVYHPMDFATIDRNIKRQVYGSTEAFIADVKWILHNCLVFNGKNHPLSSVARTMIKMCCHEAAELHICPDCYLNSCVKENEDWFCEPCRKLHVLVWAKMKGYPFWPAKVLREENNQVDVRFFGEHDRAWVPLNQVYLISENPPGVVPKKTKGFDIARSELSRHVELLKKKFGSFTYAADKTSYESSSKTFKSELSTIETSSCSSDVNLSLAVTEMTSPPPCDAVSTPFQNKSAISVRKSLSSSAKSRLGKRAVQKAKLHGRGDSPEIKRRLSARRQSMVHHEGSSAPLEESKSDDNDRPSGWNKIVLKINKAHLIQKSLSAEASKQEDESESMESNDDDDDDDEDNKDGGDVQDELVDQSAQEEGEDVEMIGDVTGCDRINDSETSNNDLLSGDQELRCSITRDDRVVDSGKEKNDDGCMMYKKCDIEKVIDIQDTISPSPVINVETPKISAAREDMVAASDGSKIFLPETSLNKNEANSENNSFDVSNEKEMMKMSADCIPVGSELKRDVDDSASISSHVPVIAAESDGFVETIGSPTFGENSLYFSANVTMEDEESSCKDEPREAERSVLDAPRVEKKDDLLVNDEAEDGHDDDCLELRKALAEESTSDFKCEVKLADEVKHLEKNCDTLESSKNEFDDTYDEADDILVEVDDQSEEISLGVVVIEQDEDGDDHNGEVIHVEELDLSTIPDTSMDVSTVPSSSLSIQAPVSFILSSPSPVTRETRLLSPLKSTTSRCISSANVSHIIKHSSEFLASISLSSATTVGHSPLPSAPVVLFPIVSSPSSSTLRSSSSVSSSAPPPVFDASSLLPTSLSPLSSPLDSEIFKKFNIEKGDVSMKKYINKLTSSLENVLAEFVDDMFNPGQSNVLQQLVIRELENVRKAYATELEAFKHTAALQMAEMKLSYQHEKEKFEAEKLKEIADIKTKLWCASCLKVAKFNCCWKVNYCSPQCQTSHWSKHEKECAHLSEKPTVPCSSDIIRIQSHRPISTIKKQPVLRNDLKSNPSRSRPLKQISKTIQPVAQVVEQAKRRAPSTVHHMLATTGVTSLTTLQPSHVVQQGRQQQRLLFQQQQQLQHQQQLLIRGQATNVIRPTQSYVRAIQPRIIAPLPGLSVTQNFVPH